MTPQTLGVLFWLEQHVFEISWHYTNIFGSYLASTLQLSKVKVILIIDLVQYSERWCTMHARCLNDIRTTYTLYTHFHFTVNGSKRSTLCILHDNLFKLRSFEKKRNWVLSKLISSSACDTKSIICLRQISFVWSALKYIFTRICVLNYYYYYLSVSASYFMKMCPFHFNRKPNILWTAYRYR